MVNGTSFRSLSHGPVSHTLRCGYYQMFDGLMRWTWRDWRDEEKKDRTQTVV